MWNDSEPPYRKTGMFDHELLENPSPEQQKQMRKQAELYRAAFDITYGMRAGRGMGKSRSLAEEIRANVNSLDSGKLGTGILYAKPPTELPKKICAYRKPTVNWYGTETPRYTLGYGAAHFDLSSMIIKGRDPRDGLSVFPQGKRFVGISEPAESEKLDDEFLMSFTGDEWVETKTYPKDGFNWSPQGEIVFMSGKPLNIKDKE